MKPKVLKVGGLNSFEEEQVIYFEKLTEKGLFGIFGPTGSGKSTILDAITIALYGKITRTNKGYINTTTKNLTVSYQFEVGVGSERKVYTAERNLKVNKAGGYNTKYARLLEKTGEQDIIVAEGPSELQNHIEKIIGLTVEDFTRSVVLPQGKFSEFLKLTGKDKRDMLERIFSLQRYGTRLGEKIKKFRNGHLKEDNILTGELKKYDGLTEEVYKEKEKRLAYLLEEEKTIALEKKELHKEYEKCSLIWELQKELKYYKSEEEKLKEKIEEIKQEEIKLEKGRKSLSLKPFINEMLGTESSLEENKKQLEKVTVELKKVEEKLSLTEKNYNEIIEKKEELVPNLIKKEANLIQAIEISKKINDFKNQIKSLRTDYSKINNDKVNIGSEIKQLAIAKEENANKIIQIENRLNEIKIDPDYREKLQEASEKENEYNQCEKRKSQLEVKLSLRKANLEKLTKEYEEAFKCEREQSLIVEELERKGKELDKDNPGDNSILLDKAELLNSSRERLDKGIKNEERKKELECKLEDIKSRKNPIIDALEGSREKLNYRKNYLQQLIEEIHKINKLNLSSILREELQEGKPCPVCGSLHHLNSVEKFDVEALEHKEKEKKELEEEIEELNRLINTFSLNIMGFQKEEEHILEELSELYKNLQGIILKDLKVHKEKLEKEFSDLKDRLEKYSKEKELIESQIILQKDKSTEYSMKVVKLLEMIKSEKSIIDDLCQECSKEKENIEKVKEEIICLKKHLNIDNIGHKVKEIKALEREVIDLEKIRKELSMIIEKSDKEREVLTSKEKELEIELGKITQSGKEKAQVIEREEEQFNNLTEHKNPQEYLKLVQQEIKYINSESEQLKKTLEEEKIQRQRLWDSKVSLDEGEKILQKRLQEQKANLYKALQVNGFKDIEEALKAYIEEEEINKIQKAIEEFKDRYRNLLSNISRVEKKLNGEFIEEEKWEKLKKDREEKEELLSIKIREIAALQKTIEDLKKNIAELKELRSKQEILQHKLSLLNDLSKLIEGNKFVEFAAMSQLKYIAREASRRLKSITRDRYALEIDGEGNFTIRDDFNGGEIRDTSTLSGGETFLTSLSLALALSTQVQLKGSAPLEFFFLDEGFGTLDSELLDIVMNSLENLHNSRLSVGIITHVEELKNRVPVKLIVSPSKQGEGGSKVTLEYS